MKRALFLLLASASMALAGVNNPGGSGGGGSASAPLTLTGTGDAIQLVVKGNSAQTNKVFEAQNSGGTDLFDIDNSGNITLAGTLSGTLQIRTGNTAYISTYSLASGEFGLDTTLGNLYLNETTSAAVGTIIAGPSATYPVNQLVSPPSVANPGVIAVTSAASTGHATSGIFNFKTAAQAVTGGTNTSGGMTFATGQVTANSTFAATSGDANFGCGTVVAGATTSGNLSTGNIQFISGNLQLTAGSSANATVGNVTIDTGTVSGTTSGTILNGGVSIGQQSAAVVGLGLIYDSSPTAVTVTPNTTGAGSLGTATISGTTRGTITVVTSASGTAPAAGTICTVTSALGNISGGAGNVFLVVGSYSLHIWPQNAATAALSGASQVYSVNGAASTTIHSGTTPLATNTTYVWGFDLHVF